MRHRARQTTATIMPETPKRVFETLGFVIMFIGAELIAKKAIGKQTGIGAGLVLAAVGAAMMIKAAKEE